MTIIERQPTPREILANMNEQDRLLTLLKEHPMLMQKAANEVVEAYASLLSKKRVYEETLASTTLHIRAEPLEYTSITGKLTESTIEAIAIMQNAVRHDAREYEKAQVAHEKAKRHHEDLEHVWQSIRYQVQIYVASQPQEK